MISIELNWSISRWLYVLIAGLHIPSPRTACLWLYGTMTSFGGMTDFFPLFYDSLSVLSSAAAGVCYSHMRPAKHPYLLLPLRVVVLTLPGERSV